MRYAGIGSRQTPASVLELMTMIASSMSHAGWILRSGGARGADLAFEKGATLKEIFLASDATPEAIELASAFHPAWDRCSSYARSLHGRNSQILLGRHLDTPVQCVICWTPRGALVGGTAQAIRLAQARSIPVFNLAVDNHREVVCRRLSIPPSL